MRTKETLGYLHTMVMDTLSENMPTRDDDNLLYKVLVEKFYGANFKSMSAAELLEDIISGKLPKYESVGRARRKCQANDSCVGASVDCKRRRINNIKEYQEYNREYRV